MKNLKMYSIKIIVLSILVFSIILCGYTTINYNKSIGNQNNFQQNDNLKHGFNNSFNSTASNVSTTVYSSYLYGYGILFLCVSALGYYFFIHKKFKIPPEHEKILFIGFLIIGFFLRISLSSIITGYPGDINLFKNWATSVSNSLTSFYSGSKISDYPPLYMYILFLIGKLAKLNIFTSYYVLLLKLPSIIADIATTYLIYRMSKKHISLELRLLLLAFYIFNPAIFINSTIWGQVDSFFTLLIVLSIYLLFKNKLLFSSIIFTMAILMKPQGIIFLPVLFFELVRKKNFKNFIKVILAAIFSAFLIILPFSLNKDFTWIFKLYSSTISEYPYATMNAFNFFYLIGANLLEDTSNLFIFSYHSWGMIFIFLTTLFSWYVYIKVNNSNIAFLAALMQIAGVFIFSVGMHERYLFPAVALTIFAFIQIQDKRLLFLAAGFSTTSYLNTHIILFDTLKGNMNTITYSPINTIVSASNVLLLLFLVKILIDISINKKQVL